VPIAIDTKLIQFEGWTLRVHASQDQKRILLLIHGYTGDENSLWVFARDVSPHYHIVAPRGMHPSGAAGYSWRPVPGFDLGMPRLDQLRPAADALIRLVDAYQASAGIDVVQFDVMGFSQGGVMANVLAFLYPQRVRKAGILAAFVPDGLDEFVPMRPLEGKPFFVAHGRQDDTVSVERARESIAILEQAGAVVTYCEDDVGHKVSLKCLQALKRFFGD
jgi:predicted esterase